LLSFTLYLDATGAMILFAGIYYGAMYGGPHVDISKYTG
jgi:TctA family transporter